MRGKNRLLRRYDVRRRWEPGGGVDQIEEEGIGIRKTPGQWGGGKAATFGAKLAEKGVKMERGERGRRRGGSARAMKRVVGREIENGAGGWVRGWRRKEGREML